MLLKPSVYGRVFVAMISFVLLTSLGAGSKRVEVTEESYKYVDDKGNICFASSFEATPQKYRDFHYMSSSIDPEAGAKEKISFYDVDGDGEKEILVELITQYSTGRSFKAVEVIKQVGAQFIKLVTVNIEGSKEKVQFFYLRGDSRAEIYCPGFKDPPEYWIWNNGQYINIVPRDATLSLLGWEENDTLETNLKKLLRNRGYLQ